MLPYLCVLLNDLMSGVGRIIGAYPNLYPFDGIGGLKDTLQLLRDDLFFIVHRHEYDNVWKTVCW